MDKRLRFMADLIEPLLVAPGSTVRLSRDHDPRDTGPVTRPEAAALLAEGVQLLTEYQDRLAAQDTFGVLLVLQGLDASGKDSTIKHVMSGVNPQGVAVGAFKQPSAEERNHDFLWRYQCALPGRGRIGIFNRSHYEEVLVVRVHPELLAAQRLPVAAAEHGVWARRYREINDWERYLVSNGIHVVKVMLNVSAREQARRFLGAAPLGRLPARLRQHAEPYQYPVGPLVCRASRPQMVQPAGHSRGARHGAYPAAPPGERDQLAQVRAELVAELGLRERG